MGYVQKWHLRYKTNDTGISETKQSKAKVNYRVSIYRNLFTAYRLMTNLVTI